MEGSWHLGDITFSHVQLVKLEKAELRKKGRKVDKQKAQEWSSSWK